MPNSLDEYKQWVYNNLPNGITSENGRFSINNRKFNNFKKASWYRGYLTKFGLVTEPQYDPDAQALFNRFEILPDEQRLNLINDRFVASKQTTWWPKLDALWVHAAHAPEAGRLNWISTKFNCLPVNDPAFVVDRGYTSDGVLSYLDSQFNIATEVAAGSKFQLNSGSIGIRSNSENSSDFPFMGAFTGGGSGVGTTLNPRRESGTMESRVNQQASAVSVDAVAGSIGMFATSRTSASSLRSYRQGVMVFSSTQTSITSALINQNIILGGSRPAALRPSTQFSMGWIGGGLTDAEVASIYEWFQPYREALGIV